MCDGTFLIGQCIESLHTNWRGISLWKCAGERSPLERQGTFKTWELKPLMKCSLILNIRSCLYKLCSEERDSQVVELFVLIGLLFVVTRPLWVKDMDVKSSPRAFFKSNAVTIPKNDDYYISRSHFGFVWERYYNPHCGKHELALFCRQKMTSLDRYHFRTMLRWLGPPRQMIMWKSPPNVSLVKPWNRQIMCRRHILLYYRSCNNISGLVWWEVSILDEIEILLTSSRTFSIQHEVLSLKERRNDIGND